MEGTKALTNGCHSQRGLCLPSFRDSRLTGDRFSGKPASVWFHTPVNRTRHGSIRGSPLHPSCLCLEVKFTPRWSPFHKQLLPPSTYFERQAPELALPHHANLD